MCIIPPFLFLNRIPAACNLSPLWFILRFGYPWGPMTPQYGSKMSQRWLQDAPKESQESPKRAQDAPRKAKISQKMA